MDRNKESLRLPVLQAAMRCLCHFDRQSLTALLGLMLIASVLPAAAQEAVSSTNACVSDGLGCFATLTEAEAALRKQPGYGPTYQKVSSEHKGYTDLSSVEVISYSAGDHPAVKFYPPTYSDSNGYSPKSMPVLKLKESIAMACLIRPPMSSAISIMK